MKQTVEEITKMLWARGHDEHDGIDPEEERGFLLGCETGINWQKEQGIEWISVDSPPTVQWHETTDGGSFQISIPILLWKEGCRPAIGQYWYSSVGKCYYKLDAGSFVPTYWALISLPKTD